MEQDPTFLQWVYEKLKKAIRSLPKVYSFSHHVEHSFWIIRGSVIGMTAFILIGLFFGTTWLAIIGLPLYLAILFSFGAYGAYLQSLEWRRRNLEQAKREKQRKQEKEELDEV